jgi:RNase P subunit RPR2
LAALFLSQSSEPFIILLLKVISGQAGPPLTHSSDRHYLLGPANISLLKEIGKMKSCPRCNQTYSDDATFCSSDGAAVVNTTCSKCGDSLKGGFLYRPHVRGVAGDMRGLTWIEGDSPGESISAVRERGAVQYRVTTYRCQKCGYLEIYAIEQQESFSY